MKNSHQNSSLASLHRLEFILQHQSDKFLHKYIGIGFSQVRIMDEISANNPRSQREIALRLYQTEANISRQLKDLKSRGLVKIVANKKDKRQKDVYLSSMGNKKYDQAQKIIALQHKQLLSHLSKSELKVFEHGVKNMMGVLGGPSSTR